ncbi:MAG: DUF3810 family protein [Acidobacteria bacterium]|nr:DUF3810 family protein [Acidobacteriota bacterium]
MRRGSWAIVISIAAAMLVAIAGVPFLTPATYGARFYPAIQRVATTMSNQVALPLFDVTWMSVVVIAMITVIMMVRRARRGRRLRALLNGLAGTAAVASLLYLWFVLAWGYNYRRAGVEAGLRGFDATRTTPAAVRSLAERAVAEVNSRYAPAHAQGFPTIDAVPPALVHSLDAVVAELGGARAPVPARPKTPLTAPYMRAVGVSGMLAPFYLETYLNPDLTGPERPYVLAHEWAHLAGFAPEEDASFVGVLVALGADEASRYSAWLFLVSETASRLQPVTRDLVLAPLADGPRDDLRAIAARQAFRIPWLDRASWVAYDRAIKSQGATAGVAGYGRVIELLLGSGRLDREPS